MLNSVNLKSNIFCSKDSRRPALQKIKAEPDKTIACNEHAMAIISIIPELDIESYPDYQKVIPTTPIRLSIKLNNTYLLQACDLLRTLFIKDTYKIITIDFYDDLNGIPQPLKISAKSNKTGQTAEIYIMTVK